MVGPVPIDRAELGVERTDGETFIIPTDNPDHGLESIDISARIQDTIDGASIQIYNGGAEYHGDKRLTRGDRLSWRVVFEGDELPDDDDDNGNGNGNGGGDGPTLGDDQGYIDFGEFDDGDGPTDIDWSDEWQTDGDWSISTDGGEGYTDGAALVSDPGSDPDALLLDEVSDNGVEVLARVKSDDVPSGVTPSPSHGVLVQADDAGNSYAALFSPGQTSQLQVVEFDGESRSQIGADTLDSPIVADSYYWIRFRRQTFGLQAKLWADDEDEPEDWMVAESDGAITADGSIGLVSTGSTDGPHHFDVFAYGVGGADAIVPGATDDQLTETFADDTADSQPDNWTPQLNATGGEYTVREDESALGGKYLEIDAEDDEPLTWDLPGESTDVEILARHRYTDSDSNGLGFVARFDGDNEDYLNWRTSGSSTEVYIILDGSFDDADNDVDLEADEDLWYRSRTRLEGDDLYYKIWIDGTTEPSEWEFESIGFLSGLDSPGSVGIHDFNTGNIGELDWIAVGIDGAEAPTPVAEGSQFEADFGDDIGGTTPDDWTLQLDAGPDSHTVREEFGAVGGRLLELDAGLDEALTWDAPGEVDDVEIHARHRYTDENSFGVGLTARFEDDETFVQWRTYWVGTEIFARVDGSNVAGEFDTGATADVGVWYLSRTRLDGDDLYYKIWPDDEDEPEGWDMEETGLLSDIDTPGLVGLFDLNSGNAGEVDWMTVGVDGAEAPTPDRATLEAVERWAGMVIEPEYERIFADPDGQVFDEYVGRISIDAEGYVFRTLADRFVYRIYDDEPVEDIVEELIENDAPEIDVDIEPTGETATVASSGLNLLEIIEYLAGVSNSLLYGRGNTLVMRLVDDLEPEFELGIDDIAHSLTVSENPDDLVNFLRLDGGTAARAEDSQETQDDWETVTTDDHIAVRVSATRSRLDRVEIFTRHIDGSEDNIRARLQRDEDGGPIAPSDTASDIDRAELDFDDGRFNDEDWSVFFFSDHTLHDQDPWLIVDSGGETGHEVGVNASDELTFRAFYQYPIINEDQNTSSIVNYGRVERPITDSSIRTTRAAQDRATEELRHNSSPRRELQVEPSSRRAHELRPGDVVTLGPIFEPEGATGDWVVADVDSAFANLHLRTTLMLRELDTL